MGAIYLPNKIAFIIFTSLPTIINRVGFLLPTVYPMKEKNPSTSFHVPVSCLPQNGWTIGWYWKTFQISEVQGQTKNRNLPEIFVITVAQNILVKGSFFFVKTSISLLVDGLANPCLKRSENCRKRKSFIFLFLLSRRPGWPSLICDLGYFSSKGDGRLLLSS